MLQFFDIDTPSSTPGSDGEFTERVQDMFLAPPIADGNQDQYADGGGPVLMPNQNRGLHYAVRTAQGIGTENGEHRMGHLSCLQRTSRAADGAPIHIRIDGSGFDAMDVPGGVKVPKLQFTIFAPSRRLLQEPADQPGLPRPAGQVRRQPERQRPRALPHRDPPAELSRPARRHRAFPLAEFT